MKIDLFITCFNDTLFPGTGKATVDVLERLGHQVAFRPDQTCCGQMHYNSGYQREAARLVRHFVEVFRDSETIVCPSASCVAMIREFYPQIAAEEPLRTSAQELIPRVFELSELLVNRLGIDDVGAVFPHRVAYHPTCHSMRTLHVGDAPLRLLRNVRDLELVEIEGATECCGFGGTFAIKNAETSSAMLADKLQSLSDSGAEMCVALDNSCLMHIGGALQRNSGGTRTVHLAEVLAARGPE